MTKKEILAWLKVQKVEALAKVETTKKEAVEQFWESVYASTNLKEVADKIQLLFNEIDTVVMDWYKQYPDFTCRGSYYHCLHYVASPYVNGENATYQQMTYNEFMREPEKLKDIKKHYESVKANVATNYDNVILNVEHCANAKLAVEYLLELGFNLSDLENATKSITETALAVPVNKNFLMLGGSTE